MHFHSPLDKSNLLLAEQDKQVFFAMMPTIFKT